MLTEPQAIEQLCMACALRSRCVLSVVGPEALNGEFKLQPLRVEKGETVFPEGTHARGWIILCQGRAKLVVRTDRGRKLLLRFSCPGELLSGAALGTYPYSALAVTQATVAFIPGEDVAALGQRHPELLAEANLRLAREHRDLVRRLSALTYASVRARLVRVLLELGEAHGVGEEDGLRIDVPLSLADVAEMIGASRPTTCAELRTLGRQNLIKAAWPRVYLLDPNSLRRYR
jgi:CRP/FNR family transcriptional regulator